LTSPEREEEGSSHGASEREVDEEDGKNGSRRRKEERDDELTLTKVSFVMDEWEATHRMVELSLKLELMLEGRTESPRWMEKI
jgi:hypothetical protein